jgi:hypothetical protein
MKTDWIAFSEFQINGRGPREDRSPIQEVFTMYAKISFVSMCAAVALGALSTGLLASEAVSDEAPLAAIAPEGSPSDPAPDSAKHFRRGDVDGNGGMDITDVVVPLFWLFLGGQEPNCFDAADVDDNGQIDLTDVINQMQYLFQAGDPPAAPGVNCGIDPTEDELPECRQETCK